MDIETGYFFILDITGYTQFLAHSELDHAKKILDALFESILDNIEPLLSFPTPRARPSSAMPRRAHSTNPAIMERTYFDFRRVLQLMKLNNTCDRNACLNMSALDLIIFIHYGQYLAQQIGINTDLRGADVILVHRLMKNSVVEKFGHPGYGLLTEAELKAMGIDPIAEGVRAHVEHNEHYYAVDVYVHDLRAAWSVEHERKRSVVTAEDAVAHASFCAHSAVDRLGLCLKYGAEKDLFRPGKL